MWSQWARNLVACAVIGASVAAGIQGAVARAAVGVPSHPGDIPGRQTRVSLSELPLLSRSSINYIGAFSVPHQDGNGHSLGYAGHALTYNPSHHSLYYGGHDWYQELCEIGIPETIDLNHTAPILQDCTDVTEGRMDQIDDGTIKLGGTLLYNNRLIVSAYSYYDADGNQVLSHFASSPDLSVSGDIQGPYQVGDWAGIVSGYMAPIPLDWQPLLGGPALTGNCCLAIISRTSFGPAVSVFDPDNVGLSDPVPAAPLLYYPAAHPLAELGCNQPVFQREHQYRRRGFPQWIAQRTVHWAARDRRVLLRYGHRMRGSSGRIKRHSRLPIYPSGVGVRCARPPGGEGWTASTVGGAAVRVVAAGRDGFYR